MFSDPFLSLRIFNACPQWTQKYVLSPTTADSIICHLLEILKDKNFLAIMEGGRKGGTNTAIPHMVAREYRNTASQFTQIPKPKLPMGKS